MSGRRWMILLAVLIGGALMARSLNNDYVAVVAAENVSGWVAENEDTTWTYVSADAPSFVISINADATGYLMRGMRVRLTQTTVKYAIITAVGSYTAGATEITVYGGTDYTIADAAISSQAYSSYKAPFGFSVNPEKWTVTFSTEDYFQKDSPAADQWYDTGFSLDVPIVVWHVSYDTVAWAFGGYQIKTTLSTTTNTETNIQLSDGFAVVGATGVVKDVSAFYMYELASKTTFNLLISTAYGSTTHIRTYETVLIRAEVRVWVHATAGAANTVM